MSTQIQKFEISMKKCFIVCPCKIPSRPIWRICARVNIFLYSSLLIRFRNSTCFPSPSSFSFNKDTSSVGARRTVQSVQSFHKSPLYRVRNLNGTKSQKAFSVSFFMKMKETNVCEHEFFM